MATPVGTEPGADPDSTENQTDHTEQSYYGVLAPLEEDTGPRARRITFHALLEALPRLVGNRAFMAGMTALGVLLYLWNAPRAIDYPEWDEATYFMRATHLLHGDLVVANVFDPKASGLYVAFVAACAAVLHITLVYPWMFAISMLMIGLGAYLLLARLFHPVIALALALAVVIGTGPIVPWNVCFYFGAGALWLALALLGKRPYQRGLAAFGVLLSVYIRPEFATCLALLLGLLALYEWRTARTAKMDRARWRELALAYAPVVVGLVVTVVLVYAAPQQGYDRVSTAIPWSYNDFYNATHNPAFHGVYSYDHPWIIFEHDFGPVPSHSLVGTLLAMLRSPSHLAAYLAFDGRLLLASFGTALMGAYTWHFDEWATRLPIAPTWLNTWGIVLLLVGFTLVAALCFWGMRRFKRYEKLPLRTDIPALIGIFSLVPILFWLMLLLPQYRFFMIFPLVLAPIGFGLTGIAAQLALVLRRVPHALSVSAVLVPVLLLALVPHPYATTPAHPIAETLAFIRAHVPAGSTLLMESSDSYNAYLSADGISINMMEAPEYAEPVLVNAFAANPALGYLLFTHEFPESTYGHWFTDWDKAFPAVHWTQVAQVPALQLSLYQLPVHAGSNRLAGYTSFLRAQQQMGISIAGLPSAASIDVSQDIPWVGASPQNNVRPAPFTAWQATVTCIVLHPYYSGMSPDVPSQVSATLPQAWSGHDLLFLAALAPWAADQPGANGVQFNFTLQGTSFTQVVDFPNVWPHRWVPVIVHLPIYQGNVTLTLTMQPRTSINFDSTLLGFIGALPGGSVATSRQGA